MFREISAFVFMEFKRAFAYKVGTLQFICELAVRALIVVLMSTLWSKWYALYILLPMILSIFFSRALTGFYRVIYRDYWTGRIELFLNLPLKTLSYIFYKSTASYVWAVIQLLVYLPILLYLGPQVSIKGFLLTILAFFLCLLACIGIGLISASMFFLLRAKGGGEPISYIFSLLTELVSGLYYPLTILPYPLQLVSMLLPQTYAFDLIRRAWLNLNSPTIPLHRIFHIDYIIEDIILLLIHSAIWTILGLHCFRRSIDYARKYGLPVR